MGKDKKDLNPADAFRREQKKIEQKKNKLAKQKSQEARDLLNNPHKIEEKIAALQKESDSNRLDKGLKDQIKQYKEMLTIAINKQKMTGKYEPPSTAAEPKDDSLLINRSISSASSSHSIHPTIPAGVSRRPDESVYYHPVYNPQGQPPPGQPQMYRPIQMPQYPPRGPPYPLAVGGMNGVPLPPPRGILPIGGMNGVPPPPPRGVPIGGQYGIPPPPPQIQPFAPNQMVPPQIGQAIPSQFANFPQHSVDLQPVKSKNIDRQRTVHLNSVDPLNPSAEGYTHRPTQKPQTKTPSTYNQPSAQNIHSPQDNQPSLQQSATVSIVNTIEPEKQTNEHINVDIQPSNVEDIMRRRYELQTTVVCTNEEDDSEIVGPSLPSFDVDVSSLPSAEELLRRRFMTIDEAEQGVSVEIDRDGEEEVDKSHDLSMQASSKPIPNVAAPLSLAILGDYGDEDDEEEDSNEDLARFSDPSKHLQVQSIQFNKIYEPTPNLKELTPVTQQAQAPTQPKISKLDPSLTKFVPSSLRVKRPSASNNQPTKIPKLINEPVVAHVEPASNSGTTRNHAASSVDDAYKQFLEEISVIGGV